MANSLSMTAPLEPDQALNCSYGEGAFQLVPSGNEIKQGGETMRRSVLLGLGSVLAIALVMGLALQVLAQAPPFETRKITDAVYIFRYGGHQSISST